MHKWYIRSATLILAVAWAAKSGRTADLSPSIEGLTVTNQQAALSLPKVVGMKSWTVEVTPDLGQPFAPASAPPAERLHLDRSGPGTIGLLPSSW